MSIDKPCIKRLLVVEDSLIVQRCYQMQLSEMKQIEGYFFTHGKKALKCIDQHEKKFFDLIVLDVGLPDIDGLMLAEEIKSMEVKCPIIIVSARRFSNEFQRPYKTIIDAFYVKPVKVSTLIEWIAEK